MSSAALPPLAAGTVRADPPSGIGFDQTREAVVGNEPEKYLFVAPGIFTQSHTVFGIAMPNSLRFRTSWMIFGLHNEELAEQRAKHPNNIQRSVNGLFDARSGGLA